MAHFSKIDEDGNVLDVIVIDNQYAPDPSPVNSEKIGQEYIKELSKLDERLDGVWIQTSYNGSFRKQYGSIGCKYLFDQNIFILPKPYPSWTLNENFDWVAPIDMPIEDGVWIWDEENENWLNVEEVEDFE